MGLLNLPAPVIEWGDEAMAPLLPAPVRLLVWALFSAALCMELYRLLSPQTRIQSVRKELRVAQHEMARYDGPAEGVWPLISRVLKLASRRILLVLPATVAAALPLLAVVVWLDVNYGHRFPRGGEHVAVGAPVAGYSGALVRRDEVSPPHALLADPSGRPVLEVPVAKPVPVIHKYRIWNLLVGNPAGYLADDAPVDRISLDLPRLELIHAGPSWMRGWELLFFSALFLSALTLKLVRRIE